MTSGIYGGSAEKNSTLNWNFQMWEKRKAGQTTDRIKLKSRCAAIQCTCSNAATVHLYSGLFTLLLCSSTRKKVLVNFMVCSENVKRKPIYFQDLTHKLSERTITKQKKQKDIPEPPKSLPTINEKHTQIKRKTRKRSLPVHSCLFQTLIYWDLTNQMKIWVPDQELLVLMPADFSVHS